jgi:glycosyltransferase involved in cell wall biosynthesis
MKNLNILIITYDWPPRNSIAVYRPYAWAKYWSELGVQVTVLTAKKYIYDEPLDLTLQPILNVEVFEIEYRKNSDFEKKPKWLINYLKNKTFDYIKRHSSKIRKLLGINYDIRDRWTEAAIPVAIKIFESRKIDAVVSTFGPRSCHFIGSAIKKKYPSTKWIVDYRDLWSTRHNIDINAAMKKKEMMLEKSTVKKADFFMTVSPPLADDLSLFLGRDVEVVFNGFDTEWDDVKKIIDLSIKNGKKNNNLTITYTGMIYPGWQDPSPLFVAINDLIKDGLVDKNQISINFYGSRQPGLKEMVNSYSANSYVKIHGHVTREASLFAQQNSDLVLLLESGDDLAKGILTGKVFEYLVSGVPILSLGSQVDSAIGKLILETNTGIVCVSDINKIKKLLLAALQGNLQEIYNPKLLEIKKYSRKIQSENLMHKLYEIFWMKK